MIEPNVSLCMIVKNEENALPACLESVRGMVDEIVVLDTGSRDNTVGVAESFGAKVFHIPWSGDFSAARNESVKKAGGNWILYLDADEVLDPNGYPDCVRKAASLPSVSAWMVPIRNHKWQEASVDVTSNIRLFRKLPGLLFENEVHERIEPALLRMGARIATAPFFIDHYGYNIAPESMKKKLERNLSLSKKHLERDPDDAYCLYYLGASFLQLENTAEARRYFQRALGSRKIPLFLEAMTLNFMSFIELRENRLNDALLYAGESISLVPRQNTAYMVSGIAFFLNLEFDKAFPLLERAHDFLHLPPDKRSTDLNQEHAFIGDLECHRLLGICLSEMGRPGDAVKHFQEFFESGGADPEAARRAGLCCINTGDFRTGLKYLERAERLGVPEADLVLPRAFACLRTGDPAGAARHYFRAVPRNEEELSVAFRILEEMAADRAFRPYLADCIKSKRDIFSRAFQSRFLKLVSEVLRTAG